MRKPSVLICENNISCRYSEMPIWVMVAEKDQRGYAKTISADMRKQYFLQIFENANLLMLAENDQR